MFLSSYFSSTMIAHKSSRTLLGLMYSDYRQLCLITIRWGERGSFAVFVQWMSNSGAGREPRTSCSDANCSVAPMLMTHFPLYLEDISEANPDTSVLTAQINHLKGSLWGPLSSGGTDRESQATVWLAYCFISNLIKHVQGMSGSFVGRWTIGVLVQAISWPLNI